MSKELIDLSDLAGEPADAVVVSDSDPEVVAFLTPKPTHESPISRPLAVILFWTEYDCQSCGHIFTAPTYGQDCGMLKRYDKSKKAWIYEPVPLGAWLDLEHRIETTHKKIHVCHLCFPLDTSMFKE